MKPNGNRAILQLTKDYIMDKKKPVLDEDGQPRYVIGQAAKVLSSNIDGIKKGMTVYPIIRGGVPIYHLETKKYQVVIIDNEDIYGIEV
jgi:hypothetical protein